MFLLVVGGAANGKSHWAETRCMPLGKKRLYIATMEPFGGEAQERIARHRAMRAQRGFKTIEHYTGLTALALVPGWDVVLLEGVGTLLANCMYSPQAQCANAVQEVLRGVEMLREKATHLVVISDMLSSDGLDYAESVQEYQQNLGSTNCALAQRADWVVEVVAGLPLELKPLHE
jgi:Adenosyl cobinamide kinase/adenosyl cobinamide phosphate guanylyltransferase